METPLKYAQRMKTIYPHLNFNVEEVKILLPEKKEDKKGEYVLCRSKPLDRNNLLKYLLKPEK